ncbi:MAG: TolC family protein [Thalassotalea sp.]
MLHHKWLYFSKISLLILLASGCAQQSAIEIEKSTLAVPDTFFENSNKTSLTTDPLWLQSILPANLEQFIKVAVNENHQLKQQHLALQAIEQAAIAAGASLWPSLNINLSSNRRKNTEPVNYQTNNDLSLSLRYELDIWGKLQAFDQQINLQFASQQTQYELNKQQLIIEVILAWYQVIESKQQLALSQKQLINTEQNLNIISSGYQSGLNSALDLYLAKAQLAGEKNRLFTQQSAAVATIRKLESLLGKYPSGQLLVTENTLPLVTSEITASLTSEVISQNLSLQSSWLSLLAKDAGLAYAHKQRFPSLSFTASIATNSDDIEGLVSQSLGWSILGNLTQPLFDAGRLAANQEQARLETKQAEQSYLSLLNTVFASVENKLLQAKNLQLSVAANQQAQQNAQYANELAFDEYLKGLVSYTTVLDAQTRAFTTTSTLLQSKYQLIENQLQLFLALGGNFNSILVSGSH